MIDGIYKIIYKGNEYTVISNGNWVTSIEKFIREDLKRVPIRTTVCIWNTPEGGILMTSMKEGAIYLKDIELI